MSIKHMTLVWEHSKHEGSALLLLLAIADCADEHGEAWPGHRFLAQRIRLSRSAVQYLLAKIIKSHELKIIHRGGSGTADANHYRIVLKGQPAGPKSQGQPAGPLGPVQGQSRASDHAQILPEPLEPLEPINTNYTPPPPPAAMMPAGAVGGAGELERVDVGPTSLTPAMEPTGWTWKAIPNVPANRIKAHAYLPQTLIALYLYYLTQNGIKSPLRAALARMERGETDTGQLFEQLCELPPASLALLLNWLAEGASDYSVPEQLNGTTVLGHAFAAQFKQPPSGIQSETQQARQADAEQQTIRIVSVRALTDLNLWRLLPAIEPAGPTAPDVTMNLEPSPDVTMPTVSPLWQAALDQLWLEMVPATFDAWLRDTELTSNGPDEFVIGVPSPHVRDWLANRMTATIERTLERLTGNAWPVRFEVKGK